MKIAIPFLAGLLLAGAELLNRVMVQGAEHAFFLTVIEDGWKAIKSSGRFLPEKLPGKKIYQLTVARAR